MVDIIDVLERLIPREKTVDEETRVALEAAGWQLVGREHPVATPLNPESGRFEPRRVLSDDDIVAKYRGLYGDQGCTAVRVEPIHDPRTGQPRDDVVMVYVKR